MSLLGVGDCFPAPFPLKNLVPKPVIYCMLSDLLTFQLQSYLQIVLERLPAVERSSAGIHSQQAGRLQELVEFIQSQVLCY